jgi:uncharacterized phage protein (TIGR02216 family)
MAAGLGLLRLPPAHFWSMTPRELAAALSGVFGTSAHAQPLTRSDLTILMHRFPDRSMPMPSTAYGPREE